MTATLAKPANTYRATRAQLLYRLATPAHAGILATPDAVAFAEPAATLRLPSDRSVVDWFDYLLEQGGRVETAPGLDWDGNYRAAVDWDGWRITVTCPDPAAVHHAAVRRAIAASRAARGVTA